MNVRLANAAERELAFKIRQTVFIDEQNVPAEEEFDEFEDSSQHLIAWINDQAVGTARLRDYQGWAKFERIAVSQNWRGHKVGAALMDALLEQAAGRQCCLNAQCQAQDFYRRWGFEPVGEIFLDAGIDHIRMERRV